ncbi:MAG: chorismate mutase, partial [Candidatus Omnitrophica bacterium]|nr:chorismate mutase [Candidatus Omnitrophota bacterium]
MRKKLDDLRKEINNIDHRMIQLLSKRGQLSSAIGEIKKARKQSVYSPGRESVIYRMVTKDNKGPLADESIKAIYREIMSACISLEHPLIIAYLGPELTFTHQASIKKFGVSVTYLSCNSITDVFLEVERGNADYGVVPIENSIEGAVSHTMDMFAGSPLMICSESYLRIRHDLLSRAGSMKSIKRIYSNPQVFSQCRVWIEKNLPRAKLKDSASTAKAAEIAARHPDSACIASGQAAGRYGLNVIARSIEDS